MVAEAAVVAAGVFMVTVTEFDAEQVPFDSVRV
jgi:hypothetical protein